jgi:hypothetical protein
MAVLVVVAVKNIPMEDLVVTQGTAAAAARVGKPGRTAVLAQRRPRLEAAAAMAVTRAVPEAEAMLRPEETAGARATQAFPAVAAAQAPLPAMDPPHRAAQEARGISRL